MAVLRLAQTGGVWIAVIKAGDKGLCFAQGSKALTAGLCFALPGGAWLAVSAAGDRGTAAACCQGHMFREYTAVS